jgi:hypothetical protein
LSIRSNIWRWGSTVVEDEEGGSAFDGSDGVGDVGDSRLLSGVG